MAPGELKRWVFFLCLCGVGMLLIVLSGTGAFLWGVWYKPLRNAFSIRWNEGHPPAGQVKNTCIILTRYPHLCGEVQLFELQLYGDGKTVAWLIDEIRRRRIEERCPAIVTQVLQGLTNQNAGATRDAWLQWWDANHESDQEEWIRDGFRLQGVELETPLSNENLAALLELMAAEDAPRWTFLNAWRWLRDSYVLPKDVPYALISGARGEEVFKGFQRYTSWCIRYPIWNSPHVLRIGEDVQSGVQSPNSLRDYIGRVMWGAHMATRSGSISPGPFIAVTADAAIIVNAALGIAFLSGAILFGIGIWRLKKSTDMPNSEDKPPTNG